MRILYGKSPATAPIRPGSRESAFPVAIPLLGGPAAEPILPGSRFEDTAGAFRIFRGGEMSARIAVLDAAIDDQLESATRSAYRDLFAGAEGEYLYRVWNYVPRINEGGGDAERYRQFCLGRSEAFRERFGEGDIRYMPAGTCVGCDGDQLVIVALTGPAQPSHFENPKQLPAYRYPREYGPRSPSFARASSIVVGDARYRLISGTAAVIGHESQGIGDLPQQLAVTADNIDAIVAETLASNPLNERRAARTDVSGKVYLRHASDYEAARAFLDARFPQGRDKLIYLKSDICRRELLLEMELVFIDQLQPL